MKGPEAAALLEGLCVLLRGRDELQPQTFLLAGIRVTIGDTEEETTTARGRGSRGGMTNAEKCAHRRAKRAAERPTPPDPSTTPPPTPRVGSRGDPAPTPLGGVATPLPTPLDPTSSGVVPPSALPQSGSNGCDLSRENNDHDRSGARASATPPATPLPTPLTGSPPRSLAEAMRLPLLERAQLAFACEQRGETHLVRAMCPHEWPELQELAEYFRRVTALAHVQAGPWPSAATKRLVEMLAAPHLPSTIRQGFDALPDSSWWEDPTRRRLGLAGVSPRVLEMVLTERAEKRPKSSTRELVRRVREAGAGAPEALGTMLGRVVSGGRE